MTLMEFSRVIYKLCRSPLGVVSPPNKETIREWYETKLTDKERRMEVNDYSSMLRSAQEGKD